MLDELREEMEEKYREKEIAQDFELKKYLQQQQRKTVDEFEFLPFNVLRLTRPPQEEDVTNNVSINTPREL